MAYPRKDWQMVQMKDYYCHVPVGQQVAQLFASEVKWNNPVQFELPEVLYISFFPKRSFSILVFNLIQFLT
jgi:hypothetical protein